MPEVEIGSHGEFQLLAEVFDLPLLAGCFLHGHEIVPGERIRRAESYACVAEVLLFSYGLVVVV